LKALYLAAARGLTLARLASIPIFLVLLTHVHREGLPLWRLSLLLLYVGVALSDVFDGMLARKAGAPSQAWGRVDAVADIAFTSLSLAAAAWLGYVGPWVPVGVAILGGRFLLRNRGRQPTRDGRLVEDRAGKAAGVIYYLLVGAVALELAVEWDSGRWWVARAGDAVFLYTLFLLLRRRTERPSPSAC
jgi:phosphatidylglycerophosphate synthase